VEEWDFVMAPSFKGLYGAQPIARPRYGKRKQLKEEKKATRINNDIKENARARRACGEGAHIVV
jgi:hypothetical protein